MEDAFLERFNKHCDELKWLYMELYDNEEAFGAFAEMLRDYYEQRSETLRASDEARISDSGWYKGKDMLGMIIYADLFAGNLKGVKERIGYVEECGVNLLHIMPLLESPEGKSDGGYAVSDFRRVQPELGTMEDLDDLAGECHRRNIKLCMDFVMNHTSEDHPWAVRARHGEREFQDMYFMYDSWDIPNEMERSLPEVFPTTAPGNYTWCDEAGKVVMTSFYPYQWDLNYANPQVLLQMTANMLNLCNRGIDIIRLDAVPYIWKTMGTNCRNLPQVHSIARILHMVTDIVCPGVLLLGEVVMEPSKVVPYFGSVDKPECHMLYNVTTMCTTWNTVATKDVRLLRNQMDKLFQLPKEYLFLDYLRCHDDIGWGLDFDYLSAFGQYEVPHKKFLNDYLTGNWPYSDSRGELYNDSALLGDARLCGTTASLSGIEAAEYELNGDKLDKGIRLHNMLHAFLLTQRGMPILYSGDEIGQLNDYSYHNDPLKAADSRYLHRGRLDWEEVAKRNDQGSRQNRIFYGLRLLEEIRKAKDVFSNEADCWTIETGNDHILGIGRYYKGEKLLAFFNFSDSDEAAWVHDSDEYVDLLSGEYMAADVIGIRGCDFRWMYRRD
ncbi:MAG: alpha-amylase family protein [Firmicutes bacterium]|nr:alpha-amylase family protein [Bacillota bacterium]